MHNNLPLILASASRARVALLKQIAIIPDQIIAADINENPYPREKAVALATRLAYEKAQKITSQINQGIILAADTVPVAGGRLLAKAESKDDV